MKGTIEFWPHPLPRRNPVHALFLTRLSTPPVFCFCCLLNRTTPKIMSRPSRKQKEDIIDVGMFQSHVNYGKKKTEAAPSRIYTERTNLKPPSIAVKRREPRNYHIQLAEVFWMYFHKLADNSLIFQNSRFSGPDGHSFLGWAALVGVCVFYLRNVVKGYSLNSNII